MEKHPLLALGPKYRTQLRHIGVIPLLLLLDVKFTFSSALNITSNSVLSSIQYMNIRSSAMCVRIE